jgi:long-chain acyl-CoA synthetase
MRVLTTTLPGTTTSTRTIASLWQRAATAGRTGPAYLVEADGQWLPVSWGEAAQAVSEIANGLLALGVRKGDAFAILGRNHLEWALFDFALGTIGAVVAPVYANSSPADAAYVVRHSESVGILCEDDAHRAKIDGVEVRHVLTFADLGQLREQGRAFAEANPRALDEAAAAVGEDDLFTYIYTSGTTGPAKGCMIRNRNYYDMVTVVDSMATVLLESDTMLLYLPLAHNFGRLLHLTGAYVGYTIAFVEDPLRVGELLPKVRPTVLPSVPRVFEKIHTAVLAGFDEQSGAKRKLIDWALAVGGRVSRLRQAKQSVPPALALQHRLADRLVFAKVKAKLGGRLRVANSGGAPLAKEIAEFFHALDVLILEGYGLSECTTAATVNRIDDYRFGTVGQAMPGVELRLAADGELLMRSPTVFAGYYKDPEATSEVLDDDGWLHTGDIAEIDDEGFVSITDRKKDIIVTAGGKNVAPQNLENDLKGSRYVSQALVIGDRKPYIAALITLDEAEVARSFGSRDDPRVHDAIAAVVESVNSERSRYEQIKRFAILSRDFSAEHDEVTPTLKLKRRVAHEHFADEIAALYS